MTTYTHRLMVVPVANVACAQAVARQIANTASTGSADGMWQTPASPSGAAPATHYVCAGMIDEGFASLLGNAAGTFSAYQQAGGVTYTQADIQALYTAATIRSDLAYEGGALDGITALGLKVIATVAP